MTLAMAVSCLSYPGVAQTCSVPKTNTVDQMAQIRGEWVGYYVLGGSKTEFSVVIADAGNSLTCVVSAPPLSGEIKKEQYRFCEAGAFHFRKEVGHQFYEFDGVPKDGAMKGSLKVGDDYVKERRGEFYLKRRDRT